MKERISATIEERTRKLIDSLLKNKRYRNMSHIIESAIASLWEEENDKDKK